MMVLFTAVGYLAVRAFAPEKGMDFLAGCTGVTVIIVTVLYVCNIFNIDPIGSYENTAVVERAQFFSTLGQKDFNAGYMSVALPLVFYAFLTAKGRARTIGYAIPAAFGALALAVVDAEGLTLGIGAAMMILACTKDFDTKKMRRGAIVGVMFFAWGRLDALYAAVGLYPGRDLAAGKVRRASSGPAPGACLPADLGGACLAGAQGQAGNFPLSAGPGHDRRGAGRRRAGVFAGQPGSRFPLPGQAGQLLCL